MEGIGKEVFEEWMQRLMERIDRLDGIIYGNTMDFTFRELRTFAT